MRKSWMNTIVLIVSLLAVGLVGTYFFRASESKADPKKEESVFSSKEDAIYTTSEESDSMVEAELVKPQALVIFEGRLKNAFTGEDHYFLDYYGIEKAKSTKYKAFYEIQDEIDLEVWTMQSYVKKIALVFEKEDSITENYMLELAEVVIPVFTQEDDLFDEWREGYTAKDKMKADNGKYKIWAEEDFDSFTLFAEKIID